MYDLEKQPDSPLPFHVQMLAGQLAPSSIAMYERDFRAYVAFAGSAENALLPETLARWRAHLASATPYSPNTINRMLSAVKRVVQEAAIQGYVESDKAAAFQQITGVKAAALKDRIKPNARVRIEPTDMRTVCDSPDASRLIGLRDAALLATLASGALRVSELAHMQFTHIRRKGSSFVVLVLGKNDTEPREAPLSREAYGHICRWLEARRAEGVDVDFIFTGFQGRSQRLLDKPLTPSGIWLIVRDYAREAGLENIKPHDFRRFVGTQLARKDIRQAQKALGHKRLETTARHYVLDELEPGLTDNLY